MPNIPKPELEQGAYIAYANKPGIIVDGSGDGDYIAYSNEPGTVLNGGGGGGDLNVGDLCYYSDSNTFFGLAYIKYGDVTLYDNDTDAPYLTMNSFSAAMNLTIVLRLLDGTSLDEFTFDGVFYGDSGDVNIPLDESAYTWDSDTGYLTITIPTFEAEEPTISPVFTYQS